MSIVHFLTSFFSLPFWQDHSLSDYIPTYTYVIKCVPLIRLRSEYVLVKNWDEEEMKCGRAILYYVVRSFSKQSANAFKLQLFLYSDIQQVNTYLFKKCNLKSNDRPLRLYMRQ